MDFHRRHSAMATLATVRVENASRYGTVQVDETERVTDFAEKTNKPMSGLINAGVYIFNESIFPHIPAGPASLERDVFPVLLDCGIYAQEQRGLFLDIGTPADYARAQHLQESLKTAARGQL